MFDFEIPFKKLIFSIDIRANGQQFVVQLGRWDGLSEVIPYQTFTVMRIFSHPLFNPSNLQNDVAILRLSQSVNLGATPTIGVSFF